MRNERTYIKLQKTILKLLTLVLGIMLTYSLLKMMLWRFDSDKSLAIIKKINTVADVKEVVDNGNTEVIEQNLEETGMTVSNYYRDYINMNLIDVDFTELKKMNSNTAGWIQVNGTNINYPFVQGADNAYYLTHAFDKKYNSAGWVFMDYRNNIETFDKNTIIYAHGRLDKTMFGSLKNILSSGWLDDVNNYVVKLSTEKENTLWQVFSVYHIPTTIDYLQTNFDSDEEFVEFASMLKNRSAHDFKTNVSANTKILTLSTCYNSTDKVVLHAKLIKREVK